MLVTSGGAEALADCLFGLIEPGDEVVLIEPLYEMYLPLVRFAGGIPKLVRIEPPGWELPRRALADAFSERTKLILLNSPHNPAGKVFDHDELAFIAQLLEAHDAYAVCDEVYEHLVFDDAAHVPLMTLPGMRGRTLRIGSAGKTFSVTGWKVGYVTARARRAVAGGQGASVHHLHHAAQSATRPSPSAWARTTPISPASAAAMQAKRDRLAAGLEGAGFEVLASGGTYFLSVDIRSVGFNGDDEEFCRHITTEAGVTAVPVSAFYQASDVNHFARFCFCKQDAILDEAAARLAKHFKGR